MIKACVTSLAIAIFAMSAAAQVQDRAITRSDARLQNSNILPDQQEEDFSDVTVNPALQALVDQLASDDYATRERASESLIQQRFERVEMYKILAEQQLDPEQRHRLLSIVIDQIVTTPRGAVGIQLHWEDGPIGDPGAILVDGLIPGLPAKEVLEFGDRIVLVDGASMMSMNDFVMRVQGKPPGAEVRFTVERPKRDQNGEIIFDERGEVELRTLNFTIVLGSVATLEEINEGRVMRGPIENQMQGEIGWAVRRFGPAHRTIAIPNTIPHRLGVAELKPSPYDSNPEIDSLLRQLNRIDSGMVVNELELRAQWRGKLAELIDKANAPGLAEDVRKYYLGVATRYAELISH